MTWKKRIYQILPFKTVLGKWLVSDFIDKPIFLVGSGRSGTTALALALNQHPYIDFSSNEAAISLPLSSMAGEYFSGENNKWQKGNVRLDESTFREQLKRLLFESIWGANYGLRRNLGVFQGALARIKESQRWGTKAFPTESGFTGMNWMFPQANYIYIIRNGIDVVASMQKFPGFSEKTFRECCEFWAITVERYDYLRFQDQAITIRFEDFLNDRETILETIQARFKIEHSDKPSIFAGSTVVHPQNEKTQQSDPTKIIGERAPAWKEWSVEERSIFKDVCSTAMQRLDYKVPF